MKSIEKLTKVVENLSMLEDSFIKKDCARLIAEFLADNTKTYERGKLYAKDFVCKDVLRPAMMWIFHDIEHKVAVATDAHVLYASAQEYIEPNEKDLERFGSIGGVPRNQYGMTPGEDDWSGKYPNWVGVVPDADKCKPFEVRKDLAQVIKTIEGICKANGLKKKDQTIRIKLWEDGENQIWVDGRYASVFVKAGLDGWTCSKESPSTRALVKRWDDGSLLLLMPVIYNDSENENNKLGIPEEHTKGGYYISGMYY